MTGSDPKTDLHRYLQDAREALLWKLDGLSEYNIRRPMVPTGTNLLGLIKHVASVELGYFGDCFGRPFGEPLPWLEDDAEPNADMWATADESREQITGLYRRAWAHSDATIGTLVLDAIGHVPWWPDNRSEVTLHKILVHMIAETDRHAGQADIVRELIDGATGLRDGNDSMAPGDQAWWESYRSRLECAALKASEGPAREVGQQSVTRGTLVATAGRGFGRPAGLPELAPGGAVRHAHGFGRGHRQDGGLSRQVLQQQPAARQPGGHAQADQRHERRDDPAALLGRGLPDHQDIDQHADRGYAEHGGEQQAGHPPGPERYREQRQDDGIQRAHSQQQHAWPEPVQDPDQGRPGQSARSAGAQGQADHARRHRLVAQDHDDDQLETGPDRVHEHD
jgi:uncharacterized damage-inducible protein DinB